MSKPSFFGPRLKILDSVLHRCYYHAVFSIKHKNGWWMFKLLVQSRLGSMFDWPSDLLTTAVMDDSKITSYPEDVCFLSHLFPPQTRVDSLGRAKRDTPPAVPPATLPSEGAYFAGAAAAAVPTSRPGESAAGDFTPLCFATADVSLKCVNNILSDRANVWQQDGRDATCGNIFSLKSVIYLTHAGGMWTLETWHKGNNFCFDSSSQVGQMTRLTIKWAQSDRTDSIWMPETYLRSHLQVMELSIICFHWIDQIR